MMFAVTAFAQDAIHGVDGYYNWTPKQMKADNLLTRGNHTWVGSAVTKAVSLTYYDDFARINMGQTGTKVFSGDTKIYGNFRTDWGTNFTGINPLKITKKYPIIAIKIGLPDSVVAKNYSMQLVLNWKYNGDSAMVPGTNTTSNNCYTVSGYNITDLAYYRDSAYRFTDATMTSTIKTGGVDGSLGHGGWSQNGRMYVFSSNTYANSWGSKDSIYTYTPTGPRWIKERKFTYGYNSRFALGDSIFLRATTGAQTQSKLQGWIKVQDPVASDIYYVDLNKVFKRDSLRFNINRDLEVVDFDAIMENFTCDTSKVITLFNESGDSIGLDTIAKTREELPYYQIKWIKTFSTLDELINSTTQNFGDGNDTRSDNQLILNASLYNAKMSLQNYAHTDPLYFDAYQAALDAAKIIYATVAPSEDKTSAEWIAWDATVAQAVTDLAAARENFLKGIAANLTNPYNVLKTGNGEAEFMIGADAIVNKVGCKLITLGGKDSGTPFVMVKSSSLVNGRTAYTLSNAYGRVCLIKDTLALVPTAKLASATTAMFVFSNRADNEYPAYDIYVNGKFLYLNATTGKLAYASTVPDGEISELGAYLFDIAPATYDASGDDPTITQFTGWEFENGNLDGWRVNGYRNYGNIESLLIKDKGCAMLTVMPTYYAGIDTLKTTLLNTDFTVAGGAGTLFCREDGTYPNSARLEPTVRDSTYIIWTNTYQKRYLAMKMAATDTVAKLNSLGLFAVKSIDEISFNLSNVAGKKGDVIYWDMLTMGVPYGNKGWSCQYLSMTGYTADTQKVYVDWIRPYATIDEIPNELLDINSAVRNLYENSVVKVLVDNKKIIVKAENASTISLYTVSGLKVASKFNTEATFNVNTQGVYIVTVLENNQLVTRKVMIK